MIYKDSRIYDLRKGSLHYAFKMAKPIRSICFDDPPPEGEDRFNPSDIISLADSRFLFCDNNVGHALYELRFRPEGKKKGPLIRKPILGVKPGVVDDLEGLTPAEDNQQKFIFAVSSLSVKKRKKAHSFKPKKTARNCLLRIAVEKRDKLQAEIINDFRAWVIEKVPEVRDFADVHDDAGGINVEGLCWNPEENILLVGFRTPLIDELPFVLPIRLKTPSCIWSLDSLKALPLIQLNLKNSDGDQGIRAMCYHPSKKLIFIVTGNAISESEVPYNLYSWNGNKQGSVRHLSKIRFHRMIKVEGITYGTINDRGAMVFVDDAGGYQILWDDDPSLKM